MGLQYLDLDSQPLWVRLLFIVGVLVLFGAGPILIAPIISRWRPWNGPRL